MEAVIRFMEERTGLASRPAGSKDYLSTKDSSHEMSLKQTATTDSLQDTVSWYYRRSCLKTLFIPGIVFWGEPVWHGRLVPVISGNGEMSFVV